MTDLKKSIEEKIASGRLAFEEEKSKVVASWEKRIDTVNFASLDDIKELGVALSHLAASMIWLGSGIPALLDADQWEAVVWMIILSPLWFVLCAIPGYVAGFVFLMPPVVILSIPLKEYFKHRLERETRREWQPPAESAGLLEMIRGCELVFERLVQAEKEVLSSAQRLGIQFSLDYSARIEQKLDALALTDCAKAIPKIENEINQFARAAEQDHRNLVKAAKLYDDATLSYKHANREAQATRNDSIIDFSDDLRVALGNVKGYLEKREWSKFASVMTYISEQCMILHDNARRGQSSHRNERTKAETERSTQTDDPYVILGVSVSATSTQIHTAWKKLCVQVHPDRAVGTTDAIRKLAEAEAKKINSAYNTIKEQRRKAGTW